MTIRYLDDLQTYGFYCAGVPVNKQLTREMTGVVNDFKEIGNFYTEGGGQVIRLSVVGAVGGFSVAQTYEFTTMYDAGNSGWKALIPEKTRLYFFFNDIRIDVRTNLHTTYLRIRKTVASNDPFTAKIRIEFLGNYDSVFTEMDASGNDATVTLNHEEFKPVNNWIPAPFNAGWSNFGAPHAVGAYRRHHDYTVELKGLVKKSSSLVSGDVIFTLPPGFRPIEYRLFSTISNSSLGRIDVQSNGDLAVFLGSQEWISLQGISYTAEA